VVRLGLCLGAAVGLLALPGCASSPKHDAIHVVRPGETIYRISRYYGVRVEDVVRANQIDDVTNVEVGKRLRIPGTRKQPPRAALPQAASLPAPIQGDPRAQARREANLEFGWPVRGRVSSGFGWRNGRHHDGIDIPARGGTHIQAAEAGRVIHSGGGLGAYGRVVILKHAGRYKTVYAHNRANRVRKGQFVEKGEVIAEVGASGNASGAHVHFEVRVDRKPQDPLRYLP
jgi:murein DD-endopeptidase MepM/ murein hydrolase activator NlpD